MNEQSREQLKKIRKAFEDRFVWKVRPVGVKKGDKEQLEYVMGGWIKDWGDDVSLEDVWNFFLPHLISSDEIKREAYKDVIWYAVYNYVEKAWEDGYLNRSKGMDLINMRRDFIAKVEEDIETLTQSKEDDELKQATRAGISKATKSAIHYLSESTSEREKNAQ